MGNSRRAILVVGRARRRCCGLYSASEYGFLGIDVDMEKGG